MPKWMDSAREFLGLGEDPYYDDDYDDVVDGPDEYADEAPQRRPARVRPAEPEWEEPDGGVRMITTPADAPPVQVAQPPTSSDRGVVRPLPGSAKPEVVSPTRFDDVQDVADAFKRSQPVIVNLQGVDKDLSRRLIDFASGLCYGLEGEMERVAEQVFLVTPKGAEISADDRRRIAEGNVDDLDN